MNRILRLSTCIIIMGVGLLGCQQGVTDVGNPTISAKPPQASPSILNPGPTLGQLIGGYSSLSSVASEITPSSDGPRGSPSPTATSIRPACKTDPQKIQSITSTSDPTQIILNDFLDYGPGTDNILATYDSKTGAIAFEVSDPSVAIGACTGTAIVVNEAVQITLVCQASGTGAAECTSVFVKVAQ